MVCQHNGPAWVLGIGRFWDDPKALVRVMNESDDFLFCGSHGPRTAREVEGVISADPPLEMNGQVEIQQSH